MTDNETIKALECCTIGTFACGKECPYYSSKSNLKVSSCRFELMCEISDLINRQKEEIERLQKENEILSKNADTAFQDGLNEAQDLYALQIKNEIKSETVKEFAERLSNSSIVIENPLGQKYRVVTTLEIDNIEKEMVGENNA